MYNPTQMSREIAIEMYKQIYGEVPKQTAQEAFDYELMIDSGTFEEQQLRFDILRHAKTAQLTNDTEFGEIALAQMESTLSRKYIFKPKFTPRCRVRPINIK